MSPLSRIAVSLALLVALPLAAQAQSYPARPIRLIVPFPPGGALDFTARLISQPLAASLAQPVVVENRAGAGGAIADEFVSRAAPDGYTILYSVGSDMTTRKFMSKRAGVDPLKDLTFIATAVGSVSCVVAGPAFPARTLQELIEQARRNPGKITYGSAGVASYQHLIGELLKQHGVDMVHVPYKGLGPAFTGLMTGEVDIALTNFAVALPQLKEGKARVLAVLESRRYPGAPDVPTVSEELPGFSAPFSWFGFFGPPELPQAIVAKLNAGVAMALEAPEVSGRIRGANLNIIVTPVDQLRSFLISTSDAFGRIARSAGIQPAD